MSQSIDSLKSAIEELMKEAESKVYFDTTTALIINPDGSWEAIIGGHPAVMIGEYLDYGSDYNANHRGPMEAIESLREAVKREPSRSRR